MAARFPKCFLSCSLDDRDAPVLGWFRDMLYALEFEAVTGDHPEARAPAEKVRDLVQACEVVVAVLTKRDKVEGREVWRAPEWVQGEIGMAYAAGKTPAVFVEEGVDLGGFASQITHYERFDRGNLGEAAPRVARYLLTLRNSLAAAPLGANQASIVRALAYELGSRMAEIDVADQTLELNAWTLSGLYAKITGRIYLLPNDIVAEVEDAYAAISEMADLVASARAAVGVDLTFRRAVLGKAPAVDDALKKEKAKEAVRAIVEHKPQAMNRVGIAVVHLLLLGWPEARRFLEAASKAAGTGAKQGGATAPPNQASPVAPEPSSRP